MNNIILDEKVNLNKDEIVNFQDGAEEKFKSYVKTNLLKGFIEFQDALIDFYVNFVTEDDMPGTTAAVDQENKLIFINDKIAWCIINQSKPEAAEIFDEKFHGILDIKDICPLTSMLIRHELLHAMLDHHGQAVAYYTNILFPGKDPNQLTDEEYDEVMDEMWAPCLVYGEYNGGKGIPAHNGSGDYDLSRSYILKDIEINEKLGGLVLENNPKWYGYGFKDLLQSIIAEENRLKKKLYPIVEGEFNLDGTFTAKSETPSWYSQATEIDPEDVLNIRILTENSRFHDIDDLDKINCFLYTWVDNTDQKANAQYAWYISSRNYMNSRNYIHQCDCTDKLDIYPVIQVQHLQEYKKLKPGDSTKCFGYNAKVLNKSCIVLTDSIGKSEFNTYDLGERSSVYKYSSVYFFIKDWAEEQMKKYNLRKLM